MPRVRMLPLLALTLSGTLLIVGCGSSDAPDTAPATPAERTPLTTAPASPSPSTSPGTTATSSVPTATPTPTATPKPGRHKTGLLGPRPRTMDTQEHLLAAGRMPTLAGDRAWTVRSTVTEDPAGDRAVGACQKTTLGTIGAMSAVRRTFEAPGGIAATQVVARFPDSRSAWRAHEVLAAWRADCEERLDAPDAAIGPLRPVHVRAGIGESYRAAYGRDARARSAGLGILRTGAYLTLVEISAAAGDYPDGWDPTRVAVRRISRTF